MGYELIDKVYLLSGYPERLSDVLAECKRVSLDVEVITTPAFVDPLLDHIKMMLGVMKKIAEDPDVKKYAMILEDDVVFHKNFRDETAKVMRFLRDNDPEMDVLLFYSDACKAKIDKADTPIVKASGQLCNHCQLVTKEFCRKSVDNTEFLLSTYKASDQWFSRYTNCYVTRRHLAKQRVYYNRIKGRVCCGGPEGLPSFTDS